MSEINSAFMPTNDYIFKRLFGYAGNEHFTKDLLENILNTKIENIEVETSKILERDLKDDKIGILDILANLDNTTQCNIEMQVVSYEDLAERILKYWSRLYDKSVKKGMPYSSAKKTVAVLIADFDIDFHIPKYMTSWHIREDDFPKIVLTPLLEIVIISIERFEKMQQEKVIVKNRDISEWLKFIRNPNSLEVEKMENEEIKKAKEEYDKIIEDNRERRLAELRMKYIMDMKSIKNTGFHDGVKKGRKEGKIEGKEERNIEIAKKMLADKADIEIIIKYTRSYKRRNRKIIIKIKNF